MAETLSEPSDQRTVALVTRNPAIERSLRTLLESGGLAVRSYESPLLLVRAPEAIEETCVLLDAEAAPAGAGLEDLLLAVRGSKLVILLAETADLSGGVRRLMDEVFDLFETPFEPAALMESVRQALKVASGRAAVFASGGAEGLTDRERQVLEHLIRGESAKLIGKALGCQTALKIDPLSASKIDPSVGCPGLAARRVAIS